MTDPEITEEADRLHREHGHPPGYTGPCWGPSLAELRRAERNVKFRRAEQRAADPMGRPVAGEHAKLRSRHRHTCLECRATYECEQRCDPDSLGDSLCPGCFREVSRP